VTEAVDLINNADSLAPCPTARDEATTKAWTRYHAALALAAHAAAHRLLGKDPVMFGALTLVAVSATAAAIALTTTPDEVARELWELTPECGALNGEWSAWLVETLDRLGVNPADVDPDYSAADFSSPSVKVEVSA
jgi:hypothetical protein